MYIDAQNLFSNAQAVTATDISTNVLDLGATPTLRDLGAGTPIYLVVAQGGSTALTDNSGTDGTIVITLESDDNTGLSSATTHLTSPTITATYQRYLGLRYTIANMTATNPAIDAFLTTDPNAWTAYPNAYTTVS
jgi:hypothetical protein